MNEKKRTTLIGVFQDRLEAQKAIGELEQAGFDKDDLGFVIRGEEAVHGGMITDAMGTKDARGAVAGMVTGGMVGGVLAAAAALMLPGVGPIVAGGILASFFGGAVAGVGVGGIIGAMMGLGVSEDEALFYENEFQSGKAIVAVKAGARAAEAAEIMRRRGGYDIHNQPTSPIETQGVMSQP